MTFLPITLGVGRSLGAGTGGAKDRKAQTEKALQRDDHVCRFCGFRSLSYQRVVPYPDIDDKLPFATTCTFCEQCLVLERANVTGAGTLIWLPEIGQAELNHIVRAIYIARNTKDEIAESAKRALDGLMARRAEAKKRLGSDDPILLATVMQEMMNRKEADLASKKLDGIRLLPPDKYIIRGVSGDINQFPKMMEYWRSPQGPFAGFPVDSWKDMLQNATAKIGHA